MPSPSTDVTPVKSTLPLKNNDCKSTQSQNLNPNTRKSVTRPKKADNGEGFASAWYSRWPFFQGPRVKTPTSNAQTSYHSDQENSPGSQPHHDSRRAVKSENAVRRPSSIPLPLSNSNMGASQTDRVTVEGRSPLTRPAHLSSSISQFTRQQGPEYLDSRSSLPNTPEQDPKIQRRLSRSIHTCSKEDDEHSGLYASSNQLTRTITNASGGATLTEHFPNSPVHVDQAFPTIAPLSTLYAGDAKPYTSRACATEREVNLKLNDHPPTNVINKDETISDLNTNSCQPSTAYPNGNDAARAEQRLSLSPEPAVHHDSDSYAHRLHSQSASQHESYEIVPDKSLGVPELFLRSSNSPALGGIANTGVPYRPKQDPLTPGYVPTPGSRILRLSDIHPSSGPITSATESGPFLSPEPSIFSSTLSEEFSNPSSSNSAFSESHDRLLSQILNAMQKDSLLSSDMDDVVESALAAYKSICEDETNVSESKRLRYKISRKHIKDLANAEVIERRFLVLVTARNALLLRQMAISTDIGLALELLSPKLCIHIKDEALLAGVYADILSIKKYHFDRQVDANLSDIEDNPGMMPYDSSLLEKIMEMQQQLQPSFTKLADSRSAAHHFIKDPIALIENRLGKYYSLSRR